ncbi:type II toxin-antitoxin system VapC family toxin [Rhodopseudomonas palustris]|uniref:type II toxin-antitoxin system VapC family toxin n=1 Tax=Rhodopseudomonas palustris TaxID=1076 RepID=UPI002ACEE4D9|nr:type II toxin-antitoxin system VapC family toxin [Rhodopseudomonas palustris]WQG98479.1 type II toxin-antitoxin system VapC family toxin [Rhodopseudomonas palustris]
MSDPSGFLVDTSIVSAFAPGRPAVAEQTARWMIAQGEAERLHLSVITVAEIERGCRKLARAGGTARAQALSAWLRELIDLYGDRLLPIDAATARIAGAIEDQAIANGVHPGFADVLIAATARAHALSVLTANISHFRPLGVSCFNPVDGLPD